MRLKSKMLRSVAFRQILNLIFGSRSATKSGHRSWCSKWYRKITLPVVLQGPVALTGVLGATTDFLVHIFSKDQSTKPHCCKYIKITADALAKYMNTIESYVSWQDRWAWMKARLWASIKIIINCPVPLYAVDIARERGHPVFVRRNAVVTPTG